jgi:hypothetical protein
VKFMTVPSGVTMQLTRRTLKFQPLTTGKDDPGYQETQKLLPLVPTAEEIYKQKDTVGAAANTGATKYLSSC